MSGEATRSYFEQPKIVRLLDLSFAAMVILIVASGAIYFIFLEATLQNVYPLGILAFFTILILYFRIQAMEIPDDHERLKRFFRLWVLVAVIGFIFGLFIILTYPI